MGVNLHPQPIYTPMGVQINLHPRPWGCKFTPPTTPKSVHTFGLGFARKSCILLEGERGLDGPMYRRFWIHVETDPDCPIFMHVYIVLCVKFDVGRRFVYMWRGLDGPTFVHVYIHNSEGRGRKGRVLVDVERAGGPDCFMQVHTYFLIYTFISFFGSVAFCVAQEKKKLYGPCAGTYIRHCRHCVQP